MAEAKWNGQVIAKSDATIKVEGNHYFPPEAVDPNYLQSSPAKTVCPWKGSASYYDVIVDGEVAQGAAWFYPEPKPAAADIKGYIAFWRGVRVKN